MGSFYITPVKQLDPLPLAPDLADTVIDISEPVGILTDGFNGVLDAFDALGITLMVGFTFVARLCIRKLRGNKTWKQRLFLNCRHLLKRVLTQ